MLQSCAEASLRERGNGTKPELLGTVFCWLWLGFPSALLPYQLWRAPAAIDRGLSATSLCLQDDILRLSDTVRSEAIYYPVWWKVVLSQIACIWGHLLPGQIIRFSATSENSHLPCKIMKVQFVLEAHSITFNHIPLIVLLVFKKYEIRVIRSTTELMQRWSLVPDHSWAGCRF